MTDNDIVTVNLKLPRGKRREFKQTVKKQNHKSMQLVLSAFANAYIEKPEQFCIELGGTGDGPSIRQEIES